ncbi:cytochrome c3 family protein [Shewanella sp. JL219SE-S6]
MDDSEAHENQQCRSCHGDYSDLKNPALEIDPHGSHLGDIACTSCHKGTKHPNFTAMNATLLNINPCPLPMSKPNRPGTKNGISKKFSRLSPRDQNKAQMWW